MAAIAKHLRRLDLGVTASLASASQRVDQHIGVLHQIIVNDRFDCLALFGCNFRRLKRKAGATARNAQPKAKPQCTAHVAPG
jgi:hypothetical protein